MARRGSWASLALAIVALGCAPSTPTSAPTAGARNPALAPATDHSLANDPAVPPVAARLPASHGPLDPSQTAVDGVTSGSVVTETESCAGCHADVAAEWAASAHAFGSFNNPIYRASVDRFRRVVGKDASRFCAGCHDVAL